MPSYFCASPKRCGHESAKLANCHFMGTQIKVGCNAYSVLWLLGHKPTRPRKFKPATFDFVLFGRSGAHQEFTGGSHKLFVVA